MVTVKTHKGLKCREYNVECSAINGTIAFIAASPQFRKCHGREGRENVRCEGWGGGTFSGISAVAVITCINPIQDGPINTLPWKELTKAQPLPKINSKWLLGMERTFSSGV